ncbi:MAG: hypothetical protein IKP97_03700 [Kiritimatiellae bacterium]|nr:hypothetical protein [Kiritimatiellia bacterium]
MSKILWGLVGVTMLGLLLSGCHARCDITYRQHELEYGETAIASVTCQNKGYFIFGTWPVCSGMPWREGLLKDWEPERDWFDDHVTLDDNMAMIRLASREAGSDRITRLRTEVDENGLWSAFILQRRSITTTAVLLKNKTEQ